MKEKYLVNFSEKEYEAIKRFLELPFLDEFYESLGLHYPFLWYLLQIKKDKLIDGLKGDVDIIMGNLNWVDPKKYETIKWSPLTDYLVGIEVKCAYFEPQSGTIKSTKSSQRKINRIRLQVNGLLNMGFDRVALLDIIVNPVASGTDGQAWGTALSNARRSTEKMKDILETRLSEDSSVDHWVLSIGSVSGGDETKRGAIFPVQLQRADNLQNLLTNSDIQLRRQEMEKNLTTILSTIPVPRSFPVVYIECRTCGNIHGKEDTCKND